MGIGKLKRFGKGFQKGFVKPYRKIGKYGGKAMDFTVGNIVPTVNKLDKFTQKINRKTDGQLSRMTTHALGFEGKEIRRKAKLAGDKFGKGVLLAEATVQAVGPGSSKKERLRALDTIRHVGQSEIKGRQMGIVKAQDERAHLRGDDKATTRVMAAREKDKRKQEKERRERLARNLQTTINQNQMNTISDPPPAYDVQMEEEDEYDADDYAAAVQPMVMHAQGGKSGAVDVRGGSRSGR